LEKEAWVVLFDEGGQPYYANLETGEASYDPPRALLEEDLLEVGEEEKGTTAAAAAAAAATTAGHGSDGHGSSPAPRSPVTEGEASDAGRAADLPAATSEAEPSRGQRVPFQQFGQFEQFEQFEQFQQHEVSREVAEAEAAASAAQREAHMLAEKLAETEQALSDLEGVDDELNAAKEELGRTGSDLEASAQALLEAQAETAELAKTTKGKHASLLLRKVKDLDKALAALTKESARAAVAGAKAAAKAEKALTVELTTEKKKHAKEAARLEREVTSLRTAAAASKKKNTFQTKNTLSSGDNASRSEATTSEDRRSGLLYRCLVKWWLPSSWSSSSVQVASDEMVEAHTRNRNLTKVELNQTKAELSTALSNASKLAAQVSSLSSSLEVSVATAEALAAKVEKAKLKLAARSDSLRQATQMLDQAQEQKAKLQEAAGLSSQQAEAATQALEVRLATAELEKAELGCALKQSYETEAEISLADLRVSLEGEWQLKLGSVRETCEALATETATLKRELEAAKDEGARAVEAAKEERRREVEENVAEAAALRKQLQGEVERLADCVSTLEQELAEAESAKLRAEDAACVAAAERKSLDERMAAEQRAEREEARQREGQLEELAAADKEKEAEVAEVAAAAALAAEVRGKELELAALEAADEWGEVVRQVKAAAAIEAEEAAVARAKLEEDAKEALLLLEKRFDQVSADAAEAARKKEEERRDRERRNDDGGDDEEYEQSMEVKNPPPNLHRALANGDAAAPAADSGAGGDAAGGAAVQKVQEFEFEDGAADVLFEGWFEKMDRRLFPTPDAQTLVHQGGEEAAAAETGGRRSKLWGLVPSASTKPFGSVLPAMRSLLRFGGAPLSSSYQWRYVVVSRSQGLQVWTPPLEARSLSTTDELSIFPGRFLRVATSKHAKRSEGDAVALAHSLTAKAGFTLKAQVPAHQILAVGVVSTQTTVTQAAAAAPALEEDEEGRGKEGVGAESRVGVSYWSSDGVLFDDGTETQPLPAVQSTAVGEDTVVGASVASAVPYEWTLLTSERAWRFRGAVAPGAVARCVGSLQRLQRREQQQQRLKKMEARQGPEEEEKEEKEEEEEEEEEPLDDEEFYEEGEGVRERFGEEIDEEEKEEWRGDNGQ